MNQLYTLSTSRAISCVVSELRVSAQKEERKSADCR